MGKLGNEGKTGKEGKKGNEIEKEERREEVTNNNEKNPLPNLPVTQKKSMIPFSEKDSPKNTNNTIKRRISKALEEFIKDPDLGNDLKNIVKGVAEYLNVSQDQVSEVLQEMKVKGDIFEPKKGHIEVRYTLH